MNNLDKLIEALKDTDEVKRFRRLDSLIRENEELFLKYEKLHEISKELVNAKELGLENCTDMYQKKYDELLEELNSNVLFFEYQESVSEIKNLINRITKTIEIDIEKALEDE